MIESKTVPGVALDCGCVATIRLALLPQYGCEFEGYDTEVDGGALTSTCEALARPTRIQVTPELVTTELRDRLRAKGVTVEDMEVTA